MFCSVTASYSFLFDILTRFRQNHPQVEIKLHTGDPEEAMDRVMAGEEDISIGARPVRLPNALAFRPIAVSPLVFIAHRAQRSSFDWAVTPMILPERGVGRNRADEWFHQRGIAPRIYAQVAGNEAIVSMVSLGFGVGVVPEIVLGNSPLADRVRILDVRPPLAAYEVGLVTLERRRSNPLVEAFWNTLEQDSPTEAG
jgi:LysR family positive regulator for ilvC